MAKRSRLNEQIRETLVPYRGSKLIVAVSGGLDSVTLLDLLLRHREDLDLTLIVAHLDHGLRRASTKDARFVEKLAASYSLPFSTTRIELNPGGNVEARARDARYRWLESVRKKRQADYIVTAHQADDQVETLFLHLTRGSGLAGLGGMSVENGELLRPLIDVPRRKVAKYARAHRLAYRRDFSNRSVKMARNRIRHQVITALQRINPQLIETVSQSMKVFDDEYQVIKHLADERFNKAVTKRAAGSLDLSRSQLRRMKLGLRHVVWREALRELAGDLNGFNLRHIENLDKLLNLQTGSTFHLPRGIVVTRQYESVRLRLGSSAQPKQVRLPLPGKVRFGDSLVQAGGRVPAGATQRITVDKAAIGKGLVVRPPSVGDRFKPAGMRGSKLVSDLLTDAKVPRDERAWVPIVTTKSGEIIWVAGLRADRRFARAGKGGMVLSITPAS